MGHLLGYRAADVGKLHGNKTSRSTAHFASTLRLTFAALTLLVISGSASIAQSSAFGGMAGNWSGGGTVALEDGSSERIRCRSSDVVGANGAGLNLSLTCASDSYKFEFKANVVAEGGAISGSWSETTKGVSGALEGRGSNGSFQVAASAPGFNANISVRTTGNKQSISIRADSQFRGATISLSR